MCELRDTLVGIQQGRLRDPFGWRHRVPRFGERVGEQPDARPAPVGITAALGEPARWGGRRMGYTPPMLRLRHPPGVLSLLGLVVGALRMKGHIYLDRTEHAYRWTGQVDARGKVTLARVGVRFR